MTLDKQLARFAEECERVHTDRWRLALTNGRSVPVSATRDEGFLLFDADAGMSLTAESLLPLTERWRELPSPVKLALPHNSCELRLRSEFPLEEENDASGTRVREHLEAMRAALHRLVSREAAAEEMACSAPADQATNGSLAELLAELLKEAGWRYHLRPGGELLADLETGSQFLQAEVGACGEGVRLGVTLYRNRAAGEEAQQALCLYLLEVNAALRYARAFFRRENAGVEAGFEVCVGGVPSVDEMGHALCALSVAARQCARELKVLGGSMAGIYRSARPPFIHTNQGA